jgi:MFS family permease
MALNVASTTCRSMFYLLFAQETLGLSLLQYGTVTGTCSLLAAVLFIPAGYIVDKYHPVPVYLAGCIFIAVANAIGFFVVRDFNTFVFISVLVSITYVLQGASNRPLLMALFPPLKFGQFCSANALCFSVALIIANAGGGVFIDKFGYRFIFVWDFVLTVAGAFIAFLMLKEWKKRGGVNFVPPLQ